MSQLSPTSAVTHHTTTVDGVPLFWREAGDSSRPTLVLLAGHPSGSHAYLPLMNRLADRWHLVAPDYPGYGFSATPAPGPWTFDRVADLTSRLLEQIGAEQYVLYLFDFGAPVGMRIATAHPDRIRGLISQNGNIAVEGFGPAAAGLADWWSDRATHQPTIDGFLSAAGTRMQWEAGLRNPEALDPVTWTLDAALLDQPGHRAAAEALLWDYQNNPALFPRWHAYLAEQRPPVLAVWGADDPFFVPAGARAFRDHQPDTDVVLLPTGHFALVEELPAITDLVNRFLERAHA